jgi:hypothetical protein
MRKILCDVCGKDAKNTLDILCHLVEDDKDGYNDNEGNVVSNRTVIFDLCNCCYNRIAGEAAKELKFLRAKYNQEEE